MSKYKTCLASEITLHVAQIVITELLQHYTLETGFVSRM